jgi:hypothetical protein
MPCLTGWGVYHARNKQMQDYGGSVFNTVLHSEVPNIVSVISIPFQSKEKQVFLIQLNAYSQHNINLLAPEFGI